MTPQSNTIYGRVTHDGSTDFIVGAWVRLYLTAEKTTADKTKGRLLDSTPPLASQYTVKDGSYTFPNLSPDSSYVVTCTAFGLPPVSSEPLNVENSPHYDFDLPLRLQITQPHIYSEEGDRLLPTLRAVAGRPFVVRLDYDHDRVKIQSVQWNPTPVPNSGIGQNEAEYFYPQPVVASLGATVTGPPYDNTPGLPGAPYSNPNNVAPSTTTNGQVTVGTPNVQMIGGNVGVTLHRTASDPTLDQALWVAIRNRTHAISFNRYRDYMERVLHSEEGNAVLDSVARRRRDGAFNLYGVGAYQFLKFATEAFLLSECGVRIKGREEGDRLDPGWEMERLGEPFTREHMEARLREYLGNPPQLPYLRRVVEASFPWLERDVVQGDRLLTARIGEPCLIELIHTYWLEEGMLMQTMNAISYRFQNVRLDGDRNPLANMELDYLRSLSNVFWGYVQDELNRLSVRRRAFEYAHQYGLTLLGKATVGVRPADNRSKFLEAFHNLLYQSSKFFKEDFQTTVIADGFPLLNSLKEVHMILAEAASNEYGSLPWTARVETLLSQFLLSRPEMREFMQSRAMVPYKEAWMPQVDAMKTLQGWTDVSVTHFRDLAVYGEQLLLSCRFGDWINVNDEDSAKNWARYWRPEIQGYLHAYRAVTGVELTSSDNVDSVVPAIHLQRRLNMQQRAMR